MKKQDNQRFLIIINNLWAKTNRHQIDTFGYKCHYSLGQTKAQSLVNNILDVCTKNTTIFPTSN